MNLRPVGYVGMSLFSFFSPHEHMLFSIGKKFSKHLNLIISSKPLNFHFFRILHILHVYPLVEAICVGGL